MSLLISQERPNGPEASQLLAELDSYLLGLYPPASNHLLSGAELEEANAIFLVARIDGRAVGCGALLLETGYSELKRVFVKPERRGSGVGEEIVQTLCSISLDRGVSTVRLETGVFQQEAIGLCRRMGFKEIGPFGEYTSDKFSVFFERRL
jgi:GNAT superfamily N-acetyltransferase